MSCRATLYARARLVAERYNMDWSKVCQTLTPIGINGLIDIGANGNTFNQVIEDNLDPNAVAGDHIDFKALGSQRYLVLAIINDELTDQGDWGYRGFNYNGNDIKNNFEETFAIDAVSSSFFNIEAVRSGIEAFPWDCMPAFGPNDRVKIGLWSAEVADHPISLLAYAMPVPSSYQPIVGRAIET